MWLYIIGGVLIVVIIVVAFIFYKGYAKLKPDPLKGIPCPPLTHSIFGHPEKMLHPLKHELRLEVTESARGPLHQLVLMKHASVFINDANEAAAVLSDFQSKGKIYGGFRFDPEVPDMLACEGAAHELRRKALGPALSNMRISSDAAVTKALLQKLSEYSERGEAMDMREVASYVAMDCVCQAAFGYDLQAVTGGSPQGTTLYKSLCTLYDQFASTGIYPSPTARKVSPEEATAAKADWKEFLLKLVAHIKTEASSQRGDLDVRNNVGHAIVQLYDENKNNSDGERKYDDTAVLSEVHQILRHGYETVAGTLQWLTYVLYKMKKVRENLERAILEHSPTAEEPYPAYLECVLKETLRRYPVAGNMTVRTPAKEGGVLAGGLPAHVGIPLHVPIFSLQNTTREWYKPKEFMPERWMDDAPAEDDANAQKAKDLFCAPKCPFMKNLSAKNCAASSTTAAADEVMFGGVGFKEDYLSFFPFSVGDRGCPAKGLVLQVLRRFLMDVVPRFRLDAVKSSMEADIGKSMHAVILPLDPAGMTISVKRITSLQALVNKQSDALVGGCAENTPDNTTAASNSDGAGTAALGGKQGGGDDGWANDDDDDDEEVPELLEPKDKSQ